MLIKFKVLLTWFGGKEKSCDKKVLGISLFNYLLLLFSSHTENDSVMVLEFVLFFILPGITVT